MTNRRYFIFILFSLFLSACGQQGPLFMPIEDETSEDEVIEKQSMENHKPETELN